MNEQDGAEPRRFPSFLDPWRKTNGPGFTPLSFLGWGGGIEFVLAAQWLFRPEFIEHRGGMFFSGSSADDSGDRRQAIDTFFRRFDDRIDLVERHSNLLSLQDLFGNDDLEPHDADLSTLVNTLADCWRALLAAEFPDREFVVEVFDDPDEPYDPQITFHRRPPEPIVVHDLPPGRLAPVDGEPVAVHLDLPPSLHGAFTGRERSAVLDARGGPDLGALLGALTPGAASVEGALTGSGCEAVLVTGFEQLWVKNRPAAEALVRGLVPALRTARAAGATAHVALADLAADTVDAVVGLLRDVPAGSGPVPVVRYAPGA
ncbi:hypothetical protein [Saccharopolyspora cebuensis]|uniref:Uncharacterized protein n=1 Tax=Saccharopolyspora cebuensis TaxID=418759 RepID=A0ABV4CRR5_9PSEU